MFPPLKRKNNPNRSFICCSHFGWFANNQSSGFGAPWAINRKGDDNHRGKWRKIDFNTWLLSVFIKTQLSNCWVSTPRKKLVPSSSPENMFRFSYIKSSQKHHQRRMSLRRRHGLARRIPPALLLPSHLAGYWQRWIPLGHWSKPLWHQTGSWSLLTWESFTADPMSRCHIPLEVQTLNFSAKIVESTILSGSIALPFFRIANRVLKGQEKTWSLTLSHQKNLCQPISVAL